MEGVDLRAESQAAAHDANAGGDMQPSTEITGAHFQPRPCRPSLRRRTNGACVAEVGPRLRWNAPAPGGADTLPATQGGRANGPEMMPMDGGWRIDGVSLRKAEATGV